MKKILVVSAVLLLLGAGTMASAVGPGWGRGPGACGGPGYGMGYGPGDCQGSGACNGPGYGRRGMGPGYGMMGPGRFDGDEEFLNETADLRKQLHDKRFEYFEKARDPKTDEETLAKLEKDIDELRDQIREKAPRGTFSRGWRR
ncbi:MAG: hypothetical protein ACWGSD_13835 [Thermodesulfobacteriota bacterium]